MLRTARQSINSDLDQLVTNLLRDDAEFDRIENRSAYREPLVRAVEILIKGEEEPRLTFSKNISNMGIGLISSDEIPSTTAVLKIEAIKGLDSRVLAECRWCKPFGANWFLSGWQFINVLQR